MATSTTLTMGDLIDETLDQLYRPVERPLRVVMGSTALSSASATTFTLSEGADSVNPSSLLEFGQEVVLVTAKTDDATPVFTCQRGYLGATAGAVPTGTVGQLNPPFPRYQVQRAIEQGVNALNAWLPCIAGLAVSRAPGRQFAPLPDDVVEVLRVQLIDPQTSLLTEVPAWDFIEDVPGGFFTKVLKLPSHIKDSDGLLVTYQTPYKWSGAGEAATIGLPLGGDDLPVLYATARLATGREVSRLEVDKVTEWNKEAAIRGGVNLRMVRDLWGDFYRRVDEVRRTQNVPRRRPFRKMPRLR